MITKINILTKNKIVTKKRIKKEIEYVNYAFSRKEFIKVLLLGCLEIGIVSVFFYHSLIAFMVLLPSIYFILKKKNQEMCNRRKRQLEKEFREVILSVAANLQAGYSVENAFCESYRDIIMLYGKESIMAGELHLLMRKLNNNEPLEEILMNLADRSGVDDIRDFAEIFQIAKRNGGNLQGIIHNTADIIEGKHEVQREIDTIISQKHLEQKIMQGMPFLMMGYLSLTTQGFFEPLYHNTTGIVIMTGCLAGYVVACILADKILDIKV